jgi:hypothetical protein
MTTLLQRHTNHSEAARGISSLPLGTPARAGVSNCGLEDPGSILGGGVG